MQRQIDTLKKDRDKDRKTLRKMQVMVTANNATITMLTDNFERRLGQAIDKVTADLELVEKPKTTDEQIKELMG